MKKFMTILLLVVLISAAAVPALAVTYYGNLTCDLCGGRGYWLRCEGVLRSSEIKQHMLASGNMCQYEIDKYGVLRECGQHDNLFAYVGVHNERETHAICFGGAVQPLCAV